MVYSLFTQHGFSLRRHGNKGGIVSTDTCLICGELECDCLKDFNEKEGVLYEPYEEQPKEVNK